MESDDDFELFSPTEESSSPVPVRKLKRLKKAKPFDDKSSRFETIDFDRSNGEDFQELDLGSRPAEENGSVYEEAGPAAKKSLGFEYVGEQLELDSGCDRLSVEDDVPAAKKASEFDSVGTELQFDTGFASLNIEEDGPSAKGALEFDSFGGGFDGKGEERTEDGEKEEETQGLGKKGAHMDGLEENKRKKKKKRRVRTGGDGDDDLKSSPSVKRIAAKERRDHLNQLRAESQRLLRESRDVGFKPVPLVQKPISSVLEKIRQRKLEVLKRSAILSKTCFTDDIGCSSREIILDDDLENASDEEIRDDKISKVTSVETSTCPPNVESNLATSCADQSINNAADSSHVNNVSYMVLDEESKQAFRAPNDDTQDLFSDSETGSKDAETPSSPLEEVLAPSILAMQLQFDSAPPDSLSSDEDENDKENIDPHPNQLAESSSFPNGDPVKVFVDDEAEEEDDSDHDLMRFQDNEEEDNEDDEELMNLIATGYEEKPIDNEMRNELHQKWLEQQDAAGTENLLQRLKSGLKQKETTLLEEDGEEEEEFGNETSGDLHPRHIIQMNLRKAKQMIHLMFTDKDDLYISDDEETETRLAKQCLFEKAVEHSTFLSPAEDKDSREAFGRIKKLNNVPDTRKKVKTMLSDTLLVRGKGNTSRKSSFLGRRSNHSLPASRKNGSNMVRSFVFERDDSSSRSSTMISEDSSQMIQKENQPTKTSRVKFNNSQSKHSAQSTKATREADSGAALFKILRYSSLQAEFSSQRGMVSHTESVLAAFKLEKPVKKQSIVSVRTI